MNATEMQEIEFEGLTIGEGRLEVLPSQKTVELTLTEYNELIDSDWELIDTYLKENIRTALWRHKKTGELEERIGLHPPDELIVIQGPKETEEEKSPKCKHENLELRGHEPPGGLSLGDLWLPDLSLQCMDCGDYILTTPRDVRKIKNIQHCKPEKCDHPLNLRSFHLAGFGAWTCLKCGERGISSPKTKLHIKIINKKEVK